jgi:hypothetical protein
VFKFSDKCCRIDEPPTAIFPKVHGNQSVELGDGCRMFAEHKKSGTHKSFLKRAFPLMLQSVDKKKMHLEI